MIFPKHTFDHTTHSALNLSHSFLLSPGPVSSTASPCPPGQFLSAGHLQRYMKHSSQGPHSEMQEGSCRRPILYKHREVFFQGHRKQGKLRLEFHFKLLPFFFF